MNIKIHIFDYVNTVCTSALSILNRHKVIKRFNGPVVAIFGAPSKAQLTNQQKHVDYYVRILSTYHEDRRTESSRNVMNTEFIVRISIINNSRY
jgi:hypothetical protein